MRLQLVFRTVCAIRFVMALGVCGIFATRPVSADLITLRDGLNSYMGTANSLLRGTAPSTVNSGGAPTSLIIGTNGPTADVNAPNVNDRGLLAFDLTPILTAAGGMPVVVNSVEVRLFITTGGTVVGTGNRRVETGVNGGAHDANQTVDIDLHAYGFAFDPTTATWNSPATGDATPGGTLGVLLASVTGLKSNPSNQTFPTTSATQQNFLSAFLTQWVQDAVDDTVDPFARFAINRPSPNLAVRNRVFFASKASTDATLRPTMVIDYTIVPEPNAWILISISAVGLAAFTRRRQNVVAHKCV